MYEDILMGFVQSDIPSEDFAYIHELFAVRKECRCIRDNFNACVEDAGVWQIVLNSMPQLKGMNKEDATKYLHDTLHCSMEGLILDKIKEFFKAVYAWLKKVFDILLPQHAAAKRTLQEMERNLPKESEIDWEFMYSTNVSKEVIYDPSNTFNGCIDLINLCQYVVNADQNIFNPAMDVSLNRNNIRMMNKRLSLYQLVRINNNNESRLKLAPAEAKIELDKRITSLNKTQYLYFTQVLKFALELETKLPAISVIKDRIQTPPDLTGVSDEAQQNISVGVVDLTELVKIILEEAGKLIPRAISFVAYAYKFKKQKEG